MNNIKNLLLKVKDDETGKQFKESIEKELKSIFGDSIECATHKEAWRDG